MMETTTSSSTVHMAENAAIRSEPEVFILAADAQATINAIKTKTIETNQDTVMRRLGPVEPSESPLPTQQQIFF